MNDISEDFNKSSSYNENDTQPSVVYYIQQVYIKISFLDISSVLE